MHNHLQPSNNHLPRKANLHKKVPPLQTRFNQKPDVGWHKASEWGLILQGMQEGWSGPWPFDVFPRALAGWPGCKRRPWTSRQLARHPSLALLLRPSTRLRLLGSFPCESIVRSRGSAPWLGLVGGRDVRARDGCSGAQPRVERNLVERGRNTGDGLGHQPRTTEPRRSSPILRNDDVGIRRSTNLHEGARLRLLPPFFAFFF